MNDDADELAARGSPSRAAAIDAARGAALVGMAFYHLSWDLAYFRWIPIGFPATPGMRLVSHSVAGAFLLLVGVSLALAHRAGFRARAFWRRIIVIAGAAALITAATYGFARDETIFFGILHCIAAASLLAAPLLRAPIAVAFIAAALAMIAPLVIGGGVFDQPALMWLGFGTTLPSTLDWRPLFPWSGVVFLGLALARSAWPGLHESALWRWRPSMSAARLLAWAGRHSLPIYLIHQPILFGIVTPLANWVQSAEQVKEASFTKSCTASCLSGKGKAEGAGGAQFCTAYCRCALMARMPLSLSIAINRTSPRVGASAPLISFSSSGTISRLSVRCGTSSANDMLRSQFTSNCLSSSRALVR